MGANLPKPRQKEFQKISSYQLFDLPDEVILKILSFLNIKELLNCGQVSGRLRAISNDESLWLKLNLYRRQVPYDFIKKAVENGCQYLSLDECDTNVTVKSESPFNLKYLNISYSNSGLLKLIQNCSSLQKLSVIDHYLDSDDIQNICQNSQTLQVLNMSLRFDLDFDFDFNFDRRKETKLLLDLCTNCAHLTELNIETDGTPFDDGTIQAIVENLTPTILKVTLGGQQNLKDEHVKKLVKRCNKITHLSLRFTPITNDSLQSIVQHLNTSLEELDVSRTTIDFDAFLQLKSVSTLKTLVCLLDAENIKNLKLQLPHVRVTSEFESEFLPIACPNKIVNGSLDNGWIWEIRAKQQDLFSVCDRIKHLFRKKPNM